MATSATDFSHPYYEKFKSMNVEEVTDFFIENPRSMSHVSLGEFLDFNSFGGGNFVVWRMDNKDLVGITNKWIRSQIPKKEWEKIPVQGFSNTYRYEEVSREYDYLWNRFHSAFEEELPFIDRESCPVEETHERTIRDFSGRLRCAHLNIERYKPGFVKTFQNGSGRRISFLEEEPMEPFIDERVLEELGSDVYDEELEAYRREMIRFEGEERSLEVHDFCYSVISDVGNYLPLESVFKRLDVSRNFSNSKDISVFPFSGFTLANFVKVWWDQKGLKIFYSPETDRDSYNKYPDFQPFSSEF